MVHFSTDEDGGGDDEEQDSPASQLSNLLPKKANLRPERTRSALSGRQGGVGTTMKLIQTGLLTKMAMRVRRTRIVTMICCWRWFWRWWRWRWRWWSAKRWERWKQEEFRKGRGAAGPRPAHLSNPATPPNQPFNPKKHPLTNPSTLKNTPQPTLQP